MSYITHIRIDGLAGNKRVIDQEIPRDVLAIYGMNGAGKTSLLRILHYALERNADFLPSLPLHSAEVTIYSDTYGRQFTQYYKQEDGKNSAELRRRAEEAQQHMWREHSPSAVSKARDAAIRAWRNAVEPEPYWHIEPPIPSGASARWAHRFLPTDRLYTHRIRRAAQRHDDAIDELFDESYAISLRQHWIRFYSHLQSLANQAQERGIAQILQDVVFPPSATKQVRSREDDAAVAIDSSEEARAAFDKTQAFLARQRAGKKKITSAVFRERFFDDPLLRRVVKRIVTIEDRIERIMSPKSRLEELLATLFQGRKRFDLSADGIRVLLPDDQRLPLSRLSSGEKHVLLILVEVLLAAESTIIVDEPEISMHVDWQASLVDAMRTLNPDAQILLATHSPEILATVPDHQILEI